MSFEHIPGHDVIKKRLLSAIDTGAVSHAYIFSGMSGVGKTAAALEFAEMLTGGSQPDIIRVTNEHYGVKEKAALSVDAVRAARVDVYTKPYAADRKVFIFSDAETMTTQAQNALLKVFEEPPPYCVIILLAQNESMLLPTIRSRAVTMRFTPLDNSIVKRYLLEKHGMESEIILRLCSGSVARADELAEANGEAMSAEFAEVFRSFASGDRSGAYKAVEIFEREKARFGILLDLIIAIAYDSMSDTHGGAGLLRQGGIKPAACLGIIDLTEKARAALNTNRNYNMVVSELMLETWRFLND